MNAPELLPCPFCGAKPMIRKYRENLVSVYCGNEKCFTWPDSDAKTLEAAALQWNTRVPPPLTPEAVEVINLQAEYIRILENALGKRAGYEYAHNTKFDTPEEAEKGKALREKLTSLASLPAKEG